MQGLWREAPKNLFDIFVASTGQREPRGLADELKQMVIVGSITT